MTDLSRSASIGLIIREKEPTNLESPFDPVDSYLTPTPLFYVRSHFPVPQLDVSTYQLRIDGAVGHPLSLDYQEIRDLPSETRVATVECAGNSRVFLVPQVPGAQWSLGAVGNAEWTGVPLRALLELAGVEERACEIVLEGADHGMAKEPPAPPDPISYARSLSKEKALAPEVLIAYQMNGCDLAFDHGYPVRALVPGHYGMASVKWLTHIEAVSVPFQGYWQTSDYGYWDHLCGKPVRRPLREMKVKSEIGRPGLHDTIAPNLSYTVSGAAWSGEGDIVKIEVSTDGGHTWEEGQFLDAVQANAWRRWTYHWLTPEKPGRYTLLARASDSNGNIQPATHDPNYGPYVINHPLQIEVFVDGLSQ
jgi:DMSO/TMAO reductase YedYZ molybdopterin-dependent catalytic subunit